MNTAKLFLVEFCVCGHTCAWLCLFATPWTTACQAPLSTGFSRQVGWAATPSPPGDCLDPGINPEVACASCTAGGLFTTAPPGKPRTALTLFNQNHWEPICARYCDGSWSESNKINSSIKFLSNLIRRKGAFKTILFVYWFMLKHWGTTESSGGLISKWPAG